LKNYDLFFSQLCSVKEESEERTLQLQTANSNLMTDLSQQLGVTENLQSKIDILQQRYKKIFGGKINFVDIFFTTQLL
jgi:tRNA/tmRNA/rRNA uracil-C5-methylase (TrmA/RlmC/RlmD family)